MCVCVCVGGVGGGGGVRGRGVCRNEMEFNSKISGGSHFHNPPSYTYTPGIPSS